jgi:hypothetical protein
LYGRWQRGEAAAEERPRQLVQARALLREIEPGVRVSRDEQRSRQQIELVVTRAREVAEIHA